MLTKAIRFLMPSGIIVWLRKRKVFFKGTFKSLQDLKIQFPEAQYHDETSLLLESKRMETTLVELQSLRILGEPKVPFNSRYVYLALVVSQFNQKVKILDVGGAGGHGFSFLMSTCPRKEIEYTIFDLDEICKLGSEKFKNFNNLSFISKTVIGSNYDIIFISATLQYFEFPFVFLESLVKLNPSIIALVQSPFSGSATFYAVQINHPKRMIPSTIVSQRLLEQFFENKNYKLSLKFEHTEMEENFNSYPKDFKNTKYFTFIFQKSS